MHAPEGGQGQRENQGEGGESGGRPALDGTGQADVAGHAAPAAPQGQQRADGQRVQPHGDQGGGNGDQDRRGGEIPVGRSRWRQALAVQDDQARDRGGANGQARDQAALRGGRGPAGPGLGGQDQRGVDGG
jgi:hypothetical protein